MASEFEVKVGQLETHVEIVRADISEIKSDLKILLRDSASIPLHISQIKINQQTIASLEEWKNTVKGKLALIGGIWILVSSLAVALATKL